MPVFGGRIPAYALEQLRAFQGGNARAVTLAVFGNRDFDDALLELNDAAAAAGFKVIASAAPIAEHSMVRSIGAGRPDAQDQKELAAFAGQVRAKLEKGDDSTPRSSGQPSLQGVRKQALGAGGIRSLHQVRTPRRRMPGWRNPGRRSQHHRCQPLHPLHALHRSLPGDARSLAAPMTQMLTGFLGKVAGGRHDNCFFL